MWWPRGRQGADGDQSGRNAGAGEQDIPAARREVGLPKRGLPSGDFFI